jgi:quinol monooxygenase YgiN
MENEITEKMVLATIRAMFSPKRFEEAMAAVRPITEQSKVQLGCLSSRIYRDGEDANTLVLQQLWANKESLGRHLRSDEYGRLLLILEMASEQPEFRFDTILHTKGIEIINKARDLSDGREGT